MEKRETEKLDDATRRQEGTGYRFRPVHRVTDGGFVTCTRFLFLEPPISLQSTFIVSPLSFSARARFGGIIAGYYHESQINWRRCDRIEVIAVISGSRGLSVTTMVALLG